MIKIKDTQFCVNNLKMKRKKGQFFFDLPERGFKLQIFNNFPAHDLNFQRFEFSWKVRVTRSNLGEEVKISRLYYKVSIKKVTT